MRLVLFGATGHVGRRIARGARARARGGRGDRLLVDAQGRSAIAFEDFAVALLDELERPRHLRQRITVAY